MIKNLKIVLTLLCGIFTLYSCSNREPESYAQSFSVIRSGAAGKYFSADEGINLVPTAFDSKWGKEGDRVIVGFYYNPAKIPDKATSINIDVESLVRIQTDSIALPPSSADTVGTGKFLDDPGAGITTDAWTAQNYLTVRFWLKYTDNAKHSFGFIEENEIYRNDTLFLKLWHNTEETTETNSAYAYTALKLDNYSSYLNRLDSTVISIKYNVGSGKEKAEDTYYYKESGN